MKKVWVLLIGIGLLAILATPAVSLDMPIGSEKSKIEFTSDSLFANVSGKFDSWTGTIDYNKKEPTASTVSVDIDLKSINTDNKRRDHHLQSDDFFDVAKFPKATFKSTRIKPVTDQNNLYDVTGQFTLHGVTKEITFPAEIREENGRIVARASFFINRQDYGIDFKSYLNPVKDVVAIRLLVETP